MARQLSAPWLLLAASLLLLCSSVAAAESTNEFMIESIMPGSRSSKAQQAAEPASLFYGGKEVATLKLGTATNCGFASNQL